MEWHPVVMHSLHGIAVVLCGCSWLCTGGTGWPGLVTCTSLSCRCAHGLQNHRDKRRLGHLALQTELLHFCRAWQGVLLVKALLQQMGR